MVPPAPVRLSTTTCCPSASPRCCATSRPELSMVPPAGYGMMKRIGRWGYGASAANADAVIARSDSDVATPWRTENAADAPWLLRRTARRNDSMPTSARLITTQHHPFADRPELFERE